MLQLSPGRDLVQLSPGNTNFKTMYPQWVRRGPENCSLSRMFTQYLGKTTGTLSQIWYGRPQETLIFKKSKKMNFKHMEYIRIWILYT
jgi:hypothetical protein